MASLKRIWTLSLAFGALLACGHATAQIAPGTGNNGRIDFTGNSVDRYDDKHLTVWHGDVEVVQNGARLVCDTLYIYSYAPGEGPEAAAQPNKPTSATKAVAPSSGANSVLGGDSTVGSVKQMIAEGHVYYVTQDQTVRGEHGVYDAEPDTITMTGAVVAVQGKNVAKSDKMIIDRKTGHTTMVSATTGRSNPDRVRAVLFNDKQESQTPAPQTPGAKTSSTQTPPAKKP